MSASPSASAASETAINAAGGSITKNSPSLIVFAIVAVVVIYWIWRRNGR